MLFKAPSHQLACCSLGAHLPPLVPPPAAPAVVTDCFMYGPKQAQDSDLSNTYALTSEDSVSGPYIQFALVGASTSTAHIRLCSGIMLF